MRKPRLLFFVTVFAFGCAYVAALRAGSAIDNVQNYSSSPFYSTDGPYNQRFPAPVYVKGPTLGAAECQLAVNSAIWTQCSFRSNCANVSLTDIQPSIVMELSTRTDANYVAACTGYINGAFNLYKQQASGAVYSASFPTATKPANYGAPASAPANPFAYYNQVPSYELAENMRKYQLEELQRQTAGPVGLQPANMPGTFEDLSFTERMEILREGWQDPAIGRYETYAQLKIEDDEKMLSRQQREAIAKEAAADARDSLRRSQELEAWCEENLMKAHKDCEGYVRNQSQDNSRLAAAREAAMNDARERGLDENAINAAAAAAEKNMQELWQILYPDSYQRELNADNAREVARQREINAGTVEGIRAEIERTRIQEREATERERLRLQTEIDLEKFRRPGGGRDTNPGGDTPTKPSIPPPSVVPPVVVDDKPPVVPWDW